jgi:hypothetical protein
MFSLSSKNDFQHKPNKININPTKEDNMQEKILTEQEQKELFQLLLSRVLLSTTREEWKRPPTSFVELSLPKKLIDFISDIGKKEEVINSIITELICRGINDLAREIEHPANIEFLIDNILNPEKPEQ